MPDIAASCVAHLAVVATHQAPAAIGPHSSPGLPVTTHMLRRRVDRRPHPTQPARLPHTACPPAAIIRRQGRAAHRLRVPPRRQRWCRSKRRHSRWRAARAPATHPGAPPPPRHHRHPLHQRRYMGAPYDEAPTSQACVATPGCVVPHAPHPPTPLCERTHTHTWHTRNEPLCARATGADSTARAADTPAVPTQEASACPHTLPASAA